MENQNIRVSIPWKHSLTNLLGHNPTSDTGIALSQWVHFQGVQTLLDLLSWEEDELKAVTVQQVFTLDDHGQGSYLRTNQAKQICGLITYMKHVFREYNSGIEIREDPFHPFSPEEWSQHTSTMLRTFLIQHLPKPIGPEPVISGPIPSFRPIGYSPAAIELMGFKKGIKREIAAYHSLKDERYFDGFKRSLFIVAKTHECNYTPGSEPEEKELLEAKQTFMFSVFNANLQTDMGKTIVRRHLAHTDAQAVWKELSEHMRTSSKGASEKRRLTQYVTNTVLDDNFKGTTEQFVLHFNEQFRQLEEISEDDERLPPTVKLTLLQTAVRSINDLRIVESLDEFQSTTHGHGSSTSLSYDTYYDLLLNACVRYDKTKKANIGKRRNVYATNIDETYIDSPTPFIDHVPDSPYGGIDLPPDEFYQVHALSSRHPPSQRPGQSSRPPFRPQPQHSSVQVGGKQRICTIDGYAMPLTCRGGLMYLSILGKPTDKDLERYPAIHLTGPHEWDPSVLDYTHPSGDGEPPWSNDPDDRSAFDPNFDEFGDYTQRAIQTLSILDDSSSTLTPCPPFMTNQHDFRTYQHAVTHEAPDYEKFRPYFGWVNVDTVQKTMEQSTQWGVSLPNTFPMKKHLKSRNPALNIPRRHEAVATDTVFSDTPAVDSGVKQAQVFVGRDTLVADAYPLKSGKQFVNTLEDNIRRWGAGGKLLSDSAKTEISHKVMDILRAYHISNWHSEPYHQNQNPAEWRYRTIKSWTNTVMNRSGAPANCWLLCLIYVCYLLNHIACTALDGKIPLLALTGITPDISINLLFTFYQPVFYAIYDQHFPSESEERAGYWVGFGEHCGDAMTHKMLDHDTQKNIYRSAVRPKKSSTPNHRLAPHGGEVSASSDPTEDEISSGSPLGYPEGYSTEQKAPTVFIRSRDEGNPSGSKPMPTFDPSDLIGKTFLLPPEENGERHRAKVTRQVAEIIDQDNGQR